MRTITLILALTSLSTTFAADYYYNPTTTPVPPPWIAPTPKKKLSTKEFLSIPEDSVKYASDGWTQEIFQYTGGARVIRPFPIRLMSDRRWHQPGGLIDVTGWKVEKYRYLPTGTTVTHYRGGISVLNSSNYYQTETGIKRDYPVSTRFDEVLFNDAGDIFEHRVREKKKDGWKSTVGFKNEEARPKGYNGLKVSCSSCHAESGTGKYADGLVPGGNTVLSDPLDLTLATEVYDPRLIRR